MNRLQLAEIEEIEVRESFVITDKQQCEWALRKIKALKAQIDETNIIADAEIQHINDWREKETKTATDSIAYFEGLLLGYMMQERENGTKSIKLPHGTIRFKKQQPEYIKDEEKLIDWAKTSGKVEYVKVKESIDWANLKKDAEVVGENLVDPETGEVIEGVRVVEREDKFEVVI